MSTAAEEAIDLAATAGLYLDPWQRLVLKWALGERADGKWAAFAVALIVARQNGKGSILEALELACLFLFGDELILHSAHEFKTAADAFRRIMTLIESTPDLERRIKSVYRAHGNEGIELKTGQRLKFVARSGGSGRGFSGDKIILDEAFNLSDKAMSALLPTMATRPNPQIWYTSSAPLDREESAVLRRLCRRGRAGDSDSLCYIEFAADDDADHGDPLAWSAANPSLDIPEHGISQEFIRLERVELSPDDFARERLGIWSDVDVTYGVIPADKWSACQSNSSVIGEPSFALDVSPDRVSAAFAVAGASSVGGAQVEVIAYDEGTHWVASLASKIQAEHPRAAFAIAENSPAWSLKGELEEAGVNLLGVSPAEHAQACGLFYDGIIEGEIHHLGAAELNKAVQGAEKKFYGDAWLWNRRSSVVDISPLVASTLAHWAHLQDDGSSVYETRDLVTL